MNARPIHPEHMVKLNGGYALSADGTVLTADASKVSGAEFVAMFAPRPSRVKELVGQLFAAAGENDRETIKAIHAELRLLSPRGQEGL